MMFVLFYIILVGYTHEWCYGCSHGMLYHGLTNADFEAKGNTYYYIYIYVYVVLICSMLALFD